MPQFRGNTGYSNRTAHIQISEQQYDRTIRIEIVEDDRNNPNATYANSFVSPEVALTIAVDLHRQATALLERERRQEEAARRQPAVTRNPSSTESGDNRAYWQDVLDPEDYQRIFGA